MAQPVSVDDVLEITLEGSVEQQPWALVRHYIVTAVASPQACIDALITKFVNEIVPAWKVCATDLWVCECLTVSRVAPKPRNPYFSQFVPAVEGDVTTDGLPPQNAVVIRLTSDEPGRSFQGRNYYSGVPEASTNGGVLLASVESVWNNLGSLLIEAIADGGNGLSPCIFSRTLYNPAADPPQAVEAYTAIVTGFSVQGNIATQRGRRTKRSSFSA